MVFVDSFLRMDFICFTQQVRRREEGGRRLVWEGGGMVGVAGVMPLVITTVRFKSLVKFFFFSHNATSSGTGPHATQHASTAAAVIRGLNVHRAASDVGREHRDDRETGRGVH